MTKKERKKIATEIAKNEIIIQGSKNEESRRQAEERVMKLTLKIDDIEDMEAIDEMIPDIIKSLIENN